MSNTEESDGLQDTESSSAAAVETDEETEYSTDEVEQVKVPVEAVVPTLDEKPERSDEKIAEWVAFKNPEHMRNWLHWGMNQGTPIRHWDQFLDSLTTMSLAKDDPEEFVQLHDVCYRWRLVTSKPMPVCTWLNYKTNKMQKKKPPPPDGAQQDSKLAAADGPSVRVADSPAGSVSDVASAAAKPVAASTVASAATASVAVAASGDASVQGSAVASAASSSNVAVSNSQQIRKKLPKDTKFLLEIMTHHQKWKPWISLQPSTIKGAGIGVFAERQFDANACIGFYVGKVLWKSQNQGYSKPSDDFFDKLGIGLTIYDLAYNDLDCKHRLVRPDRVGHFPEDDGKPLYTGCHYINNACETYRHEERREASVRENNASIEEDAIVKAVKRILPGSEIFTGYSEEEHNKSREEKKKDKKPLVLSKIPPPKGGVKQTAKKKKRTIFKKGAQKLPVGKKKKGSKWKK